ncbi:hypothetical protein [Paraburkholderia tropica]|uniref:hypothetical protein n=1 Tax=Paraburkholderia tropica TaxID=92647 RepID=UPI002AB6855E|nr:hypothetical protein [Paraburkholderia tropica]
MQNIQERHRLIAFLKACLECSVFIAPKDPGLTFEELLEAGRHMSYQAGEISDVLSQVIDLKQGGRATKLMPNPNDTVMWLHFGMSVDPDYRNPDAFDFVLDQMHQSAREFGAQSARLEREVLVERASAQQIPRNDAQVAVTMMVMSGLLVEQDGILRYAHGRTGFASPREQQRNSHQVRRNEVRERAYAAVKDVIARRSDGRPRSAEPFEAFGDALEMLGYAPFRLWWMQMVAELRQASSQTAPVTATVLAAALVEGVLTFVVAHARSLNLGTMGSKSFEGSPSKWRLDDLVASAGHGNEAAILDKPTQLRASSLILSRQRIHAGRMLSDYPSGPPDIFPEQARDAQLTAEQVVRSVVVWLQRHPASLPDAP